MAKWYKISHTNQADIDLLISFRLAKNYLEEVTAKYRKLANVYYHKSHIREFFPSKNHNNSFQKPTSYINCAIQTDTENGDRAYLHIIVNDKFEVIKTTAVPIKKQNETFVGIQVSTPFLAVNYDTQKYFQTSNDQVFQAISIGENTYIYDPTIIKSMDKNPNCIIDQT
ncbi:hypothetical protein HHI36_017941 [Cryptolaemus montrouzieri]|uniref:Uncharacterized protein n=1 Tax=Cryptolaemus montrouzieri TaxID=559131 RepID=A0ABD2NYI7_9CUCU